MRKIKIVADSSANLMELKDISFGVAPMKILTDDREITDDQELDVDEIVDYFSNYKGKSKTSCPNTDDWIQAFGDGEDIFCVTITSGLSGSYNAACVAKNLYESEYPGRRVFVIDSLSAGPELTLIVEKIESLIEKGRSFEESCEFIPKYQQQLGLLFTLESLNNFAANGRVSPAVAKLAGVLGIRIVGKASDVGTLEPTDKCRGEARAVATILRHLKEHGLKSGKVQIAHCRNEKTARTLKTMIESERPEVTVKIGKNLGLCSYYAEHGGILVGFEKF